MADSAAACVAVEINPDATSAHTEATIKARGDEDDGLSCMSELLKGPAGLRRFSTTSSAAKKQGRSKQVGIGQRFVNRPSLGLKIAVQRRMSQASVPYISTRMILTDSVLANEFGTPAVANLSCSEIHAHEDA
jgi:hypothetical protein